MPNNQTQTVSNYNESDSEADQLFDLYTAMLCCEEMTDAEIARYKYLSTNIPNANDIIEYICTGLKHLRVVLDEIADEVIWETTIRRVDCPSMPNFVDQSLAVESSPPYEQPPRYEATDPNPPSYERLYILGPLNSENTVESFGGSITVAGKGRVGMEGLLNWMQIELDAMRVRQLAEERNYAPVISKFHRHMWNVTVAQNEDQLVPVNNLEYLLDPDFGYDDFEDDSDSEDDDLSDFEEDCSLGDLNGGEMFDGDFEEYEMVEYTDAVKD